MRALVRFVLFGASLVRAAPQVVTKFSVTRTEFVVIPTPSLVDEPPVFTLPGSSVVTASCYPTSIKLAQTITESDRTYASVETVQKYKCPYPTCLACLQPPPHGCGAACWDAIPCDQCQTSSCSKCTYSTSLAQGATGIVVVRSPSTTTITILNKNAATQVTGTGAGTGTDVPIGIFDSPTVTPMSFIPALGISVPVPDLTKSFLIVQDGSLLTGIDTSTDFRPATYLPALGITLAFADLAKPMTILQHGEWELNLQGGDIGAQTTTDTQTQINTTAADTNTAISTSSTYTGTGPYTTLEGLGLAIPLDALTEQISIFGETAPAAVNTNTDTRSYTVFLGVTIPIDELTKQFGLPPPTATVVTNKDTIINSYDGGGIGAATSVAAPFEPDTSLGAQGTNLPVMVGTSGGDETRQSPGHELEVAIAVLAAFALV